LFFKKKLQLHHTLSFFAKITMLQNYFKIALRNLTRQKGYSAINIVGLAIGMAACLLMLLYIQHELSFDRFHTSAERIYRVNISAKMGDVNGIGGTTPPPVAARLMQDFPEVERATRVFPIMSSTVRSGANVFNETSVLATDEHFFKMFSFQLLAVSSSVLLSEPLTAVITRSTAEKYFGAKITAAQAIGKTLQMGDKRREFKVVGVVQNPPSTSHISFDILTSISSYPVVRDFDWSWVWCQLVTYVQLKEGSSAQALQAKLPQMVDKYAPAAFDRIGQSYADLKKQGGYWNVVLQPFADVYLHSGEAGNRIGEAGSILTVYIFAVVAALIIVLACINFVNLATARSARRAKEIGIRKSLGVARKQLVMQFLSESMLVSMIATVLAVFLVELVLHPFNTFSGKTLALDFTTNWVLSASTLALTLLVGVVAGVYPAFYLSSVKPVDVLSGKLRLGVKSRGIRNALVVFQFTVSVALITCTAIVYSQLEFVRSVDVGFAKENVLLVDNADALADKAESYKQALLGQSQVMRVSQTTSVPGRGYFLDFFKPENAPLKDLAIPSYLADEDFLPTLGATMAKGHSFSKDLSAECEEGVLLNEEAVKRIGWTDPIGQMLVYPGGDGRKFKVIGVMKNFNVASLHAAIEPFAVFHKASKAYNIRGGCMAVRVRAGQSEAAVRAAEQAWKRVAGGKPFEYSFMDEEFDRHFRSEQRLGKVLGAFTLVAIAIACLGLFGLAAFTAEQRTKEIGIRKVLGASVSSIIALLSKDFLKLVGIAIIFATPLAYWAATKWLQDFAYRVELSWWVFASAGAAAVVIAFITVASQAWRAAEANPVQSLRSE
jgi:putative ABC transport system permease protein